VIESYSKKSNLKLDPQATDTTPMAMTGRRGDVELASGEGKKRPTLRWVA